MRSHYRYSRSVPRGNRAARMRGSASLTCSGGSNRSRFRILTCALRSRGPQQKTLRREFTSACRSGARWAPRLSRACRSHRSAQRTGLRNPHAAAGPYGSPFRPSVAIMGDCSSSWCLPLPQSGLRNRRTSCVRSGSRLCPGLHAGAAGGRSGLGGFVPSYESQKMGSFMLV